jgi:dTDP-4-amino-4,6-dideoxygalactose transaminase
MAVDMGAVARAWLASKRDPHAAVEAFERAFAEWTGRRFAVTACSGRTALLAALSAAGAERGCEVILPAYTLADLPAMLRRAGMTPVFVDIDPETHLLDPNLVERAITRRTRAIIPTDLFGRAARWGDLLGDLSRARGVPLIEDAAHAAGSKVDGRPVGRDCQMAFFSLETIKVLHSFGGGVVVLDDEVLAQSIRRRLPTAPAARSFVPKKVARNLFENLVFRTPAYQAALIARGNPRIEDALLALYNRMKYGGVLTEHAYSGWQAAYAATGLRALEDRIRARRALAARFENALGDVLSFPQEQPGVEGNYYFVVARTDRDPQAIQRALVRAGVDVGVRGEITDFCPPEAAADRYPHAHRAHRSLLQLPFYEGMTDAELARISDSVRLAVARCS